MTIAEVIAAIEALLASPLIKPIEEAELATLRADLAGRPILLAILNAIAAASGL